MLDIVAFDTLDSTAREDAATVLRAALAHMSSAYATQDDARAEVAQFAAGDRIAFAALDDGRLVGWIGAIKVYDHAWELHPLVVEPQRQREGTGTRLCAQLERHAAAQGVLTLYLGTDDDFGGTDLYGADLFPDPLDKLRTISIASGHPLAFYRKRGWSVAGVVPDANGRGKPDILMAKRIG